MIPQHHHTHEPPTKSMLVSIIDDGYFLGNGRVEKVNTGYCIVADLADGYLHKIPTHMLHRMVISRSTLYAVMKAKSPGMKP